jgi:hypothetical protein
VLPADAQVYGLGYPMMVTKMTLVILIVYRAVLTELMQEIK